MDDHQTRGIIQAIEALGRLVKDQGVDAVFRDEQIDSILNTIEKQVAEPVIEAVKSSTQAASDLVDAVENLERTIAQAAILGLTEKGEIQRALKLSLADTARLSERIGQVHVARPVAEAG